MPTDSANPKPPSPNLDVAEAAHKPARIPEADRIPFGQKLAFSLGGNMQYLSTGLLEGVLWMPVFNIGMGMSPVVLGGTLMVLRIWDAITDPLMGNISDNARTRWGRRRPFMLVGALVTACLYPLFWHIPFQWGEWAKAAALLGIGIAYFTSFTVWSMPYFGLQLELTPNYDERTRLTAWMTVFTKLSALLGGWTMAAILFLGAFAAASAPTGRLVGWLHAAVVALANPQPEEKPLVIGIRAGCWIIAAAIAVFGVLPALFVRERYYEAETASQDKESLWVSIKESARCRPLWMLIGTSFFLVVGAASVSSLGLYTNFYYVCGGDLAKGAVISGLKVTALVAFGLASIPFLTWLSERYDKRMMIIAMLLCVMGGHLLNYFFMTPANPYLQIIPAIFEAVAVAAIWMFLPSMKADVADYDEVYTSKRREGAINAFYSWFIKAAGALSMGIGGFALQMSSFDSKLATQPPEVLQRMFHLFLFLPIGMWVLALLLVWHYPITRRVAEEIRDTLETRRGKL